MKNSPFRPIFGPVFCLATAALLAGVSPASAQKTVNGVFVPEGNSLAEVLQRKAANDEQVQAAKAQLDQNAASQAAYDQAQKDYQAQLARIEQQKADTDRAQADAMAKWKADVAACEAGDTTRCQH
jgi:hypothetical protein